MPLRALLICLSLLCLSACSPGLKYSKIADQMKAGNCRDAIAAIKPKAYGSNMKINYLMDSAIINMRCGNYMESNRFLHQADIVAENLWTRSISKEAASFFINDYTMPYRGEDFERALINLFSSINYAILGNYEEALVECRRLDSLLAMYNDKYDDKNVYKEDAFGRYLSGIIYEAEGNFEDAYIDYYKALQTYRDYSRNYGTPVPSSLKLDILRLADATGRLDEVSSIAGEYEREGWPRQSDVKSYGRIVMVHMNGKSPVKKSDRFIFATPNGPVPIAFPKYEVTEPHCRSSQLIISAGSYSIREAAEPVEDINRIAVKNLDDRKGRVIAKTMARMVAKQAAVNAVTKDENVKRLINILNTAVVERADTRSWRTLPGELNMASRFLPEGSYNISAGYCGKELFMENISLKAGETRFLLFDTID